MDKVTQWAKITTYLKRHGHATVRELFTECNINTPTKRISEMVNSGVPIKSVWCEATNEEGERKRFKRYYIAK